MNENNAQHKQKERSLPHHYIFSLILSLKKSRTLSVKIPQKTKLSQKSSDIRNKIQNNPKSKTDLPHVQGLILIGQDHDAGYMFKSSSHVLFQDSQDK